MIIAGLMKILAFILKLMLALLPTFDPPGTVDLSAFQVIAWLVPIGEIVNLTALMITFVIASLGYVSINWLINKVRGSG